MRTLYKWLNLTAISAIALVCGVIIASTVWFLWQARGRHYDTLEKTPPHTVALLLGTSSRTTRGTPNPFFHARMQAAADLYRTGKVRYILASGDNSHRSYNEPHRMREALIAHGVAKEHIYLDNAGYRTLHSITRAERKFGLHRYIVVSQKHHNIRALFIARAFGHDAHAYNATLRPPTFRHSAAMLQFNLREAAARVLTISDLYLFERIPEVYGTLLSVPQ